MIPDNTPPVPEPRAGAVLKPVLLLAGLLGAGLLLRQSPGLDPASLHAAIGPGPSGIATFVLGGAALTAVGVPRQAVAFAGAYLYGLAAGFGLAMAGQLIGCAVDLGWARLVARDWVRRRLLRGWLARMDAALAANPFTVTLMLRLLPTGSNILLNLLAGVSGVPVARFLAASALGYVPQTAVFALLGSGVTLGRTTRIGLGAALFAVSGLCGWALLLRRRRALRRAA